MIRKILHTFCMVALVLVCLSCVREELVPATGGVGEGEGLLLLNFGVNESVEVKTKSTLPAHTEQGVFNMYVFVFDKDGNKLAGQFFDSGNLAKSGKVDEVSSANDNCWWVNNATKDSGDKTNGRVKLRCSAGENLTLYVIANLDSDMVRVSSDLLSSAVHVEDDLKKFTAFLNQEVVSRNGRFLMTGKVSGVTINESSGTKGVTQTVICSSDKPLMLERVDAKVRFKFKKGNNVKSFEARQWKVVNVPRVAYVLNYEQRGVGVAGDRGQDYGNVDPQTAREKYLEHAGKYFTTDFVNFEDFATDGTSEFSFYMMENRQVPKITDKDEYKAGYHDRSRALKTSNDLNDKCSVSYTVNGVEHSRDIRMFKYANDFSTYVVVTGYVEMELKNNDAGNVLGGDVEYLIHLGDWGKSIDNYNIERNTSYTYTVTINSVDNIILEVETSKNGAEFKEEQPGATGQVTIAKEEIALCDCHYVSKTISFRLSNFFRNGMVESDKCIVDELTWSVKTPFGEGEPSNTGNLDFSSDLDYKWVHFRLNRKGEDGKYLETRRKYTPREFHSSDVYRSADTDNKEDDGRTPGVAGYHNDGVMTVPRLCRFIKNEVKKYLDNNITMCAFDNDTDPKITLTVFVDEYYYDENPITQEKRSDLWKWFVNQDDRKLHILCNSEKSKDMESSSTGSVVTIQQSSIQCVYNTDPSYTDLETAWGVENKDEDEELGKLEKEKYWSVTSYENRNNNDSFNGLYNSCKEWGLSSGTGNTFNGNVEWSKYMTYEVDNSTPQLLPDYKYMRFACMNRNRDNNGNGIIDREEVRWYLASIRQLVGMYVGDGLLNSKTKLYNKSADKRNSTIRSDWQQHVVSSTMNKTNSNDPTILWAEEGVSAGEFYQNYGEKGTEVRCVRNLGYIGGESNESYTIDQKPEDYIKWEKRSDGSYLFTCTHLNELALRYYTSSELIFADESSQENNLYKQFEVAPGEYDCSEAYASNPDGKSYFELYNAKVTEGVISGKGHPYCPKGYRTPSQIEAAIMRYYVPGWGNSQTLTRTYWSFGKLGNNTKDSKKVGFSVQDKNVTVNDAAITKVRCVRDVRTD